MNINSAQYKQLKEKLNFEKQEFNKVYENAKSTEWLARAGEATLNAAIQGNNSEQIEKASKQIEGMKDKFLGDGKVKGFRQVAQTLRDKIINEIEKSEKLTKKGTTRVSALAPTQPTPPPTQPTPPPTQPTPPPTQPTPPPTQPTPPPRPPSSKLAPPAKSAIPPAAAQSSQQPRVSKFTLAPPAPKSTESPKSESTKQPSSTQTVPAPKQSLPKPAPAPPEAKPPNHPPIALAQISRPISQPRKAEEPRHFLEHLNCLRLHLRHQIYHRDLSQSLEK